MGNNISAEQKEAGLMQMKINTRLTALQAAQTLMSTPGYIDRPTGAQVVTVQGGGPVNPNKVDHITLLAMAGDIEQYIIGDLAKEAEAAIAAAKSSLPSPRIMRP